MSFPHDTAMWQSLGLQDLAERMRNINGNRIDISSLGPMNMPPPAYNKVAKKGVEKKMAELAVTESPPASPPPATPGYSPIQLWREIHQIFSHYNTFLVMNLFQNHALFHTDPEVIAFMNWAHRNMICPTMTGSVEQQRALRREATLIVAEVMQKLPFLNFL